MIWSHCRLATADLNPIRFQIASLAARKLVIRVLQLSPSAQASSSHFNSSSSSSLQELKHYQEDREMEYRS